jgi:hypothetical protein
MSIKDITSGAEEKMGKSVDSVKLNLQTVRTGRANASILDRVMVEYYGAPTPLNQLATVSVPSSQQLQIDPYDKSVTAEIEKAIIESGIGLTPNNDGDVIRINIPSLTEDRYVPGNFCVCVSPCSPIRSYSANFRFTYLRARGQAKGTAEAVQGNWRGGKGRRSEREEGWR